MTAAKFPASPFLKKMKRTASQIMIFDLYLTRQPACEIPIYSFAEENEKDDFLIIPGSLPMPTYQKGIVYPDIRKRQAAANNFS
ncbi:hypothetical protein SUGI_0953310 [Cryptomeria japonica]|nr:hypothetical protein SUGI_0953310 [Cryptomeria japonica]